MGLKEIFQNAAVTAVTAFGNIGVSTNYASYASATYNASAGTNVAAYTSVAGVTIIFTHFELKEVDGVNIHAEDKKALLPAKGVASTITPKAQDRIYEAGVMWQVVKVKTDPAEALWELQVRKA